MWRFASLCGLLLLLGACDGAGGDGEPVGDTGRAVADDAGSSSRACGFLPECEGAADPGVYLCVQPPAEFDVDRYDADVTFVGPIVGGGEGEAPDGCGHIAAPVGARWFRVDDGDGDWTVQWRLGDTTPAFAPGDWVSVRWVSREEPFAADEISFEVTGPTGTTLAWYGEAGRVEDLSPPPRLPIDLALARGVELCGDENECGAWSRYGLAVAAGEETAHIRYGESATLGGTSGLHVAGGAEAATSTTVQCLDWFVARAVVGAALVEPPDPALALSCQAAADRLSELYDGVGQPPEHLAHDENPDDVALRGDEFDVMQVFEALDRIAMEDGWVLDYVYEFTGLGGAPLLYARRVDAPRLLAASEYHRLNQEPRDGVTRDYRAHVTVDGTSAAWCQLAALLVQGRQFYLYWHSHYDDRRALFARSGLDDLLAWLGSRENHGEPLTDAQREAALAIDLAPHVAVEQDIARVRFVTFTKWGGFQEQVYGISATFPHEVQTLERDELVPYECGYIF